MKVSKTACNSILEKASLAVTANTGVLPDPTSIAKVIRPHVEQWRLAIASELQSVVDEGVCVEEESVMPV